MKALKLSFGRANRARVIGFLLLLFPVTVLAELALQESFPNNFTDDGVVPKGCLFSMPSIFPLSPAVFYDEIISFSDNSELSGSVRIRAWREGCHEPGRSAIIVNLEPVGSAFVRYPARMIFSAPTLEDPRPMSFGLVPRQTAWSASTPNAPIVEHQLDGFEHGVSLVVDAPMSDVPAIAYNSQAALVLYFGDYHGLHIPVPAYDPEMNPPQYASPPWNGRFSGQWVNEDLPSTGLVLQIAEVPGAENVISAIWFTYVDGEPRWFIGNETLDMEVSEVAISLVEVTGGELMTNGPFSNEDIASETIGEMVLRTKDCHSIEADVDLTDYGSGQQSLELTRLLKIAGYACDQTQ